MDQTKLYEGMFLVAPGEADARRDDATTEGVWAVIEKPLSLRRIGAAIAETEVLARSGHHARSRV